MTTQEPPSTNLSPRFWRWTYIGFALFVAVLVVSVLVTGKITGGVLVPVVLSGATILMRFMPKRWNRRSGFIVGGVVAAIAVAAAAVAIAERHEPGPRFFGFLVAFVALLFALNIVGATLSASLQDREADADGWTSRRPPERR